MNFRLRPKSDYLHHATWEQLYALTKHWQSDLKFYSDEMTFFRHLAGNRLLWLENDKDIKAIRSIGNKLFNVSHEIESLNQLMNNHLHRLAEFSKHPTTPEQKSFREEHSVLEDQYSDFSKAFRDLKKEMFELVEVAAENGQAS